MNDETRKAMWLTVFAIIGIDLVFAMLREHARLRHWLRDYELAMNDRREELRERWMATEGID